MRKPAVRLRRAVRGDFAAMKAVLAETFETTWMPVITAEAAQLYRDNDIGGRFIEEDGHEMTVALIGDRIAGLLHLAGDFVDAIHVAPGYQGKGIGRALLLNAESEARTAGHEQIRLETDTFNTRAQAIYRGLGYQEIARYPDEEWKSGLTTILFVKALG